MTTRSPIPRMLPPQRVADSNQIAPLQYTVRDTARLLSVSRRTVDRLIERGELATVGTGRLKRVPYDAVNDFEPITKLGTITLALVGHPSVPANNVQELIGYAKANPGKLTFGAGSTSSRAAGELMKTMAGIDMLHIPYRSNPLVVTDLLGGQISLFFGDVSTSLPTLATCPAARGATARSASARATSPTCAKHRVCSPLP